MKQGVVIAHGQLGKALIDAAVGIMGNLDGLYDLSVTDMSVTDIEQRLNSIVTHPSDDVDGIVIMACLRGGSSWNVSAAVAQNKDHVRVIAGANLPMILSFITNRDRLDLDELMDKVQADSCKSIHRLDKRR